MTQLDAPWLKAAASQQVCTMLSEAGYQALFVGGCVRNTLLGQPVRDLDLATDAPPEIVVSLSQAAGLQAVPTGIDHGTVTVIAQGQPYEITTFRRDVATDGRHATVVFSSRVEEDAARRDFTMNALYAGPTGFVQDPIGGMPDLRAGHLRFIGDPASRIAEDYLRILRFFRFQAWYGNPELGIDADGLSACAAGADGLARVSAERITQEVLKLLAAPDPALSVAAMAQSGVLAHVLAGASAKALPILIHHEAGLSLPPSALRRLLCLCVKNGTEALRLSRRDQRALKDRQTALGAQMPLAELAFRKGADVALDVGLVWAALLEQPVPDTLLQDVQTGAAAKFPITAQDLMPRLQGKALGDELERLTARWIASGFSLTRSQLLAD